MVIERKTLYRQRTDATSQTPVNTYTRDTTHELKQLRVGLVDQHVEMATMRMPIDEITGNSEEQLFIQTVILVQSNGGSVVVG